MQITNNMVNAINKQINRELFSSYLYLSMSSYLESEGYNGFATWMKAQYNEEVAHAMKFYSYLFERGAKAKLEAIEAPKDKWNSVLEVFEEALAHEKLVTKMIEDLYSLAREEKDFACEAMLQWFINEQVEEESTAQDIVDKLKMAGDAKGALFMLDRELGQRQFSASTTQG